MITVDNQQSTTIDQNQKTKVKITNCEFIRLIALLISFFILSSCGPAVEGIDKGIDVIEIRTYSTPKLIQNFETATKMAEPVLELISKIEEVKEVSESDVLTEDKPFIRISFLNDIQTGKYNLLYALILINPYSSESQNKTADLELYFRSREDANWKTGTVSEADAKQLLSKIDAISKSRLINLISLSNEGLDAVRRAVAKVSADEGIFGEEIELKSIEAVDWPNTALGFPEEGKVYAMMILPGHKIVLLLPDGSSAECHTSSDRVEYKKIDLEK